MKKSFTAIVAVGALGLAACGGVDRAGTRDQFIKDIESLGETADGECIDEVMKDYSDDELEALAEADVDSEIDARSEQLALELLECTSIGSDLGG